MSEDDKYRGNLDKDVISLKERWEIKYWITQLGCSEDALRAAVSQVGPSAVKVRAHLNSPQ